jgi:hypothetical protein
MYGQCFAPSYNGRCRNKCVENSNHCELHHPKSRKLYSKYKKLSNQAKDIDLDKEFDDIQSNINYIIKCYNLYNKVYEARSKHRKFAIAPNLYDRGHDYQFVDLTNKINKCEEILNKLYHEYHYEHYQSSSDCSDDTSSSEDSIVVYEKKSMTLSEKIKLNREYRANKEQEINDYVDKYVAENKVNIDRKNLLIHNLLNCILMIFGESKIHTKIIVIISLVIKLDAIGYFRKNFVPAICKHPGCKCNVQYNLSLGAVYLQDAQCFCQYIESFSEESLKYIFEIFLFYKNKILPFVDDINELYNQHNEEIIYLIGELIWTNNKFHLVETSNNKITQKAKKPSEILAYSRLKNKYYEKQLLNDLLG